MKCEFCDKVINSSNSKYVSIINELSGLREIVPLCEYCFIKLINHEIRVCEKIIKPQLGIMPEKIWKEKRLDDLKECIRRRLVAGEKVLPEWLDEFKRLKKELGISECVFCDMF